ncbi:hypothetical protein [Oscillatoria acuminata]|uniref:Uncharacterized protein n=1 Tax=Oscillatoria acuminata PCC 6304 TaxID=56110 RepID=K9TE66_9CYAN|nr:hypothetical protein [Oscillatoria acuminata]AFY80436.1 hypothetical protein Oscil6304_0697 [Oscillatoria acuminata PCC 6304]
MESKVQTVASRGWGKWGTVAIAIVALAGAMIMQQTGLGNPRLAQTDPRQAQQQEALQLQILRRSPTLGFDNLIANYAFLKWVQYFGDEEIRDQVGYALNKEYFDVITRLDPRFAEMYPFISTAVSFAQGEPELGIQYMERGLEALSPEINPKSFLVWRFKGLDQLLLLGDIPSSIESHEMAAQWAIGTEYEDYASLYQGAADFLRTEPDSTGIRLWSWNEVYQNSINESVRQRAEQEMLNLGASKEITEDGRVIFLLPDRE